MINFNKSTPINFYFFYPNFDNILYIILLFKKKLLAENLHVYCSKYQSRHGASIETLMLYLLIITALFEFFFFEVNNANVFHLKILLVRYKEGVLNSALWVFM